jgi:hypothetical protein
MSLSSGINLAAAKLESTSAQPGQEVMVDNVPTTMGKVRVAILNPDGTVFSWARIRDVGDTNHIAMMTPLLSGDIKVKVYVRSATGPVLTLHIDPLPPAPANQGSTDLAKGIADLVDSDPFVLRASSSVPLIVHLFLDFPGNSNSISALLAGTAPSQQGLSLVDRKQVDALLAAEGAVSLIRQMKDSLRLLHDAQKSVSSASTAYRTQGISSSLGSLLSGQSKDVLNSINDAENRVINFTHDQTNSISATMATLAAAIRDNPASVTDGYKDYENLLFALTAIKLDVNLQYLYDMAYLPGAVELDPPTVTGEDFAGYGGFAFSPSFAASDSLTRMKYWTITGRIVSRPVTESASSFLSKAGLDEAGLASVATDFYTYLFGNLVDPLGSTLNWLNAQIRWLGGGNPTPRQAQLRERLRADITERKMLNDMLVDILGNTGGSIPTSIPDLQYDFNTKQITFGQKSVWYEGYLGDYCTGSFFSRSPIPPVSHLAGSYVNEFHVDAAGIADLKVDSNVPGIPAEGQTSRTIAMLFRAIGHGNPVVTATTGQPRQVAVSWSNIDTVNPIYELDSSVGHIPDSVALIVGGDKVTIVNPGVSFIDANGVTHADASVVSSGRKNLQLMPGTYTLQVAAAYKSQGGTMVMGPVQANVSITVTDYPTMSADTSVGGQVTYRWVNMDLITKVNGYTPINLVRVLDNDPSSVVWIPFQASGSFTEPLPTGTHSVGLAAGYSSGRWIYGPIQTTAFFDVAPATASLDLTIH